MGEYFSYVNHTKQLRFGVGDFGWADKFCGIGGSQTARAFCLLLTRSHDRACHSEIGMGAWIGDRVECIGDHGTLADEYDSYTCITANIIVFLHQIDGPDDLIENAKLQGGFFVQLAHLVMSNQYPFLSSDLETAFGPDWQQRATEMMDLARRNCRVPLFDIADVQL